jgi:dihydroflavonol-4-reductase
MKAFVTGGTGFIGGHVARKLRERGDDVVALVRNPEKADTLRGLGCELVEGDLSDTEALHDGVQGCDAAFHVAAMYEVGIPASRCPEMHDANVEGTRRVIDAAVEAGVPRIVYVSTVGIFGDTKGEVVDETYNRAPEGFASCYEETKYLAHQAALDRIKDGAPIVIVQPGGVYGRGDPSILGRLMNMIRRGWVPFFVFPESGFNMVHVEDVADGVLLAHDKGQVGQSYILGGEITTIRSFVERLCRISGRKPPRFTLPDWLLRVSAPLGPIVNPLLGLPPNLREMVESGKATFYATDEKARRELGYSPRDLDTGLT